MKNFFQFIIPLLIICAVGLFLMYNSDTNESEQKFHIKCDTKLSRSYSIETGLEIQYQMKDDKCKMEIEILDVNSDYVKFKTSIFMLEEKANSVIDDEAKTTLTVPKGEERVFHSKEQKVKFVFGFK